MLYHDENHNHALVQEHVHRVYTVILGSQFIYMPMHMQTWFGMYITDMHACLCKLLCTCLVCTCVLCKRASTSLMLCTQACIYMSDMQNVLLCVHAPHEFS